jgi:hypothetical protein
LPRTPDAVRRVAATEEAILDSGNIDETDAADEADGVGGPDP